MTTPTAATRDCTTPFTVLLTGAMLAWLAAIAVEASMPGVATWSAPWIGAYVLALVSALVTIVSGRKRVLRWLGLSSAILVTLGAAVKTLVSAPDPPAAGALTGVDVPFVLALGLLCAGSVSRGMAGFGGDGGRDTRTAAGIGLLLVWVMTLLTEYVARPNLWHGSEFYVVTGATVPLLFAVAAASPSGRWTVTKAAGVYMALLLVALWSFQAVPVPSEASGAEQSGHLLPPPFPLVLLLPAVVVDGLLGRLRGASRWWWRAAAVVVAGAAFVSVMLAVHWPLGDFLMSPAARTAVFGADQWPFHATLGQWRYQYWTLDLGTRRLAAGLALAMLLSTCSAGVGLLLGMAASRRR